MLKDAVAKAQRLAAQIIELVKGSIACPIAQVLTVQFGSPSAMYSSTRALSRSKYSCFPVTRHASQMPRYATPQGQSHIMSMFIV